MYRHSEKSVLLFPCLSCFLKTGIVFCFLWQTGIFFCSREAAIRSRKSLGGANTSWRIPCVRCTHNALGASRGLWDGATMVPEPLQNTGICKNSVTFTAGWEGDTARGSGRLGQGGCSVRCSAQPFPGRGLQPALSISQAQGKNAPRAASHTAAAVEFLEVAAEETLKVISLQNRLFKYSQFFFLLRSPRVWRKGLLALVGWCCPL